MAVQELDARELARTGGDATGTLALAGCRRLAADLPEQGGALAHWHVRGSQDASGTQYLALSVKADVAVVCQRCMQPFGWPVSVDSRFVLVAPGAPEPELIDAEADEPEPLAVGLRLDIAGLVEDELILALPYAPRHEHCPDGGDEPSARQNGHPAFAALAQWKSRGRPS